MKSPSAPPRRPARLPRAALLACAALAACGSGLRGSWNAAGSHRLGQTQADLQISYGGSGALYHVRPSVLTVPAAAAAQIGEWGFRLEVIQDLNGNGLYERQIDAPLATSFESTRHGAELRLAEARFRSRPDLDPLLLRWVATGADGLEDEYIVPLR